MISLVTDYENKKKQNVVLQSDFGEYRSRVWPIYIYTSWISRNVTCHSASNGKMDGLDVEEARISDGSIIK